MTHKLKLNIKYFIIGLIISLSSILSNSNINPKNINDELEVIDELKREYIKEVIKSKQSGESKFDQIFGASKQSGYFDSSECLLDATKSKEILNQMGLDKVIDDDLRFALGPCNPVLFIPGIDATRLVLQLDCKKFARKQENMINLRVFCGSSMCNSNDDKEEHVLWPALFDSPFELFVNSDNKYSSCFGHFFNYFKENECPKEKKENSQNFLEEEELQSICYYDEAVKIIFYGATEKSEKNLQCGVGPIKNILSVGNKPLPEGWINTGATLGFNNMFTRYQEMGYRSGFSMAGVPYDFRRFVNTNELFKQILINQIERLYTNTGKQVVIVAHSFGNVNFLTTLLNENSNIKNKIKKYIAIGPPFSGASKDIELYLIGSKEFGTEVSIWGKELFQIGLDTFGQQLLSPYLASGFELRPLPMMHKISKDDKYSDFIKVYDEMIRVEKTCKNQDCSDEYIKENSKYFDKYFNNFPKLNDKECKLQDLINSETFKSFEKNYQSNPKLNFPFVLPCRFGIFDVLNCPMVRYRQSETEDSSILENECINPQSNNQNVNHFYNHICDDKKECVDTFFHDNIPYPYDSEKMQFLLNRFDDKYSKLFPNLNMTTFFDSREKLQKKIEKMINHQSETSSLKEMEIPNVDTILMFGSVYPSNTAYLYDKNKNKNDFFKEDLLMKQGDGTVPTWTSLLSGMKWIYEKKINNLDTKIQIVEYCSLLGLKDSKFAFDENNLDKEFMAISCDCIDKNFYDFKSIESGKCTHATMHLDSHIIKFVEKYLIDPVNTIEDVKMISELRKSAIVNYDTKINYETQCNKKIIELVNKDI